MNSNQKLNRKRLQQLLRELFQLDFATDLDFGIYRVLNQRQDRIERFIQEDLIEIVDEVLEDLEEVEREELKERVEQRREELIEELNEDVITSDGRVKEEFRDFGASQRYIEARQQLENLTPSEEVEAHIFNDLYQFFSRYYREGDFVPQQRHSSKEAKYCVPYEGQEVMFYWANKNQYYVKTALHFNNYRFNAEDYSVEFSVVEAEEPQDNVKGEDRFFVLAENPIEYDSENNFLQVKFEHRKITEDEASSFVETYNEITGDNRSSFSRSTQKIICTSFEKRILDTLDIEQVKEVLTEKNGSTDRTRLWEHLNKFTTENTMDYFIHKNLKGFLSRELDVFLKTEILNSDDLLRSNDLQTEPSMLRARTVRKIAEKIIEFLSKIEEFQKRLFKKRKFVIQTDYMVTLDKVSTELYDEILTNDAQIQRWKEVYSVEEWDNNLTWTGEFDQDFLENHPHLMVDTAFFNEEFKTKLLSSFDDLDKERDGILIHGENYQALNLLQRRFKNDVDAVYIDPPFNSKSTEIIYKNRFKHSSWLSLMDDRISKGKRFLKDKGVFVTAIDKNEQERLGLLLNQIFPTYDKTCVTVIHNPGGIQGENFKYSHEYAYFIYPSDGAYIGLKDRPDNPDIRPFRDVSKGEHLREAAKNCFYPIFVKDGEITGFGEVCDDSFHPESVNVKRDDGTIEVYPIDPQGNERKWVFSRQNVDKVKDQLEVHYNDQRDIWDIRRIKIRFNYKTVWKDKKYNANVYGSKILNNILGEERFDFPKSLYTVKDCIDAATNNSSDSRILDFFAGSGTSAHATIKLNREDSGNRNYIMVEMGEYFDTVLRPRIQKVVFASEWKDGIPQNQDGVSHFIKYHRIESYEDALNNIELSSPETEQQQLISQEKGDYLLKYMLEIESRESLTLLPEDAFEDPFNYTLKIQGMGNMSTRRGDADAREFKSPEPEKVDFVETFHYLIGAKVQKYWKKKHQERKYIVTKCEVQKEDGPETILTVWRPNSDLDYEEEADWFKDEFGSQGASCVYVNGESHIDDWEPLEPVFRQRMESDINVA